LIRQEEFINDIKTELINWLKGKITWAIFLPHHPRKTLPDPLLDPYITLGPATVTTVPYSFGDYQGTTETTDTYIDRIGEQSLINFPIELWTGDNPKAGGSVEHDRILGLLTRSFSLNDDELTEFTIEDFSIGRTQHEEDTELFHTRCSLDIEFLIYKEIEDTKLEEIIAKGDVN
jgi:hypothetical protein